MNYIGEKIKELRQKNGMTQENLADLLGLTYQTISKWECGISSPDIYLLAPIARLFNISTDELLGVTDGNARRSEFDAAYEKGDSHWLINEQDTYRLVCEAVSEFPGEMKYLFWLAQMEKYAGADKDFIYGISDGHFKSMAEKAVKHYKTVIENTCDYELKNKAIYEIACVLCSLGRSDEAKEYAELIPEDLRTRDDILMNALSNGEQLEPMKRTVYKSVCDAIEILSRLRRYPFEDEISTATVLDTEEALIKALIPDGNYIGFYTELWMIYAQRAEIEVAKGEHEEAISHLRTSREYLDRFNAVQKSGDFKYTCPLLAGLEDKNEFGGDRTYDWMLEIGECALDSIRDRDDFKELLK